MTRTVDFPFPQDFVWSYSEAPSLHIGTDPAVGVTEDKGDDHTHKLQFALKIQRRDRKTGEVSEGVMQREVEVTVGKIPTVAEVKAANKPLYGFIRLGPGVWKLTGGPVLFIDNLAGYVTVVGCPDPAPWDAPPPAVVVPA